MMVLLLVVMLLICVCVTSWTLRTSLGSSASYRRFEMGCGAATPVDSEEEEGRLYSRQRFACRVMYDGSAFRGWQMQGPKQRTVQGIISDKLSQRFDLDVKITGAGRTDQGVHARGQGAHFDVPHDKADFDPQDLEYVLNRLLPDDIRLYNVSKIHRSVDFHATGAALGKLYVYRFCTNKIVDPTRRRYVAHFFRPVDLHLFDSCLQTFVGTHDFRAFANRVEHTTKNLAERGEGHAVDTMRTVESVRLVDEGDGYFRIEFRLKSALYRMVRNMVGTSLAVAGGTFDKAYLDQLLHEAPSRNDNGAQSSPPEGLTLEMVYYNDY